MSPHASAQRQAPAGHRRRGPLAVTQGEAVPVPDAACGVLRPVQGPSAALLARLAPLTPVPGQPDLMAHQAPDLLALWQAWRRPGTWRARWSGRCGSSPWRPEAARGDTLRHLMARGS
jgi:hypothetical protein